ncbi:MAG TPA: hypothetical protein PLC59_03985 [Bacteroidales bacterium]|jgi:hypothetical protein|nr:hypothetical protein [Bacteroidales bacterium]
MKLSQALKEKKRLADELARQKEILQRENARRSDKPSGAYLIEVWNKIHSIPLELNELKFKIAQANINIYPVLARKEEYKKLIAFLQRLNKRENEEVFYINKNKEKLSYKWDCFINHSKCDKLIENLQNEINKMQDEIDVYNNTMEIWIHKKPQKKY